MRMVTLEADGTLSTAVETPRNVLARRTGGFAAGELLYWVVILIGFAACGILARRNLRAGEGDHSGAWRLSLFVSCAGVVVAVLRTHHVPSVVDELSWLLSVTGWSVLWGGFSWLAYISFEPYGRKWWPHILVSWTRVLAGRVLDPLVGRDVLIGAFLGILSAALALIDLEVSGGSAPPWQLQLALDTLRSSRDFGGVVVFATLNAAVTSLFGLALLVLFRLILRSTWAA